jgi:transcriptional regulator with XRE-family HTH domain
MFSVKTYLGPTREGTPILGADMPRPPESVSASKRKQLGRRIHALRQAHGLSQMELAELLGVNQPHVSNIERGVRSATIQQVTKLSKQLGVSTDAILNGDRKAQAPRSLKSARLLRRLQRIEELPAAQQKAVLKILDGLLDRGSKRKGG